MFSFYILYHSFYKYENDHSTISTQKKYSKQNNILIKA